MGVLGLRTSPLREIGVFILLFPRRTIHKPIMVGQYSKTINETISNVEKMQQDVPTIEVSLRCHKGNGDLLYQASMKFIYRNVNLLFIYREEILQSNL